MKELYLTQESEGWSKLFCLGLAGAARAGFAVCRHSPAEQAIFKPKSTGRFWSIYRNLILYMISLLLKRKIHTSVTLYLYLSKGQKCASVIP